MLKVCALICACSLDFRTLSGMQRFHMVLCCVQRHCCGNWIWTDKLKPNTRRRQLVQASSSNNNKKTNNHDDDDKSKSTSKTTITTTTTIATTNNKNKNQPFPPDLLPSPPSSSSSPAPGCQAYAFKYKQGLQGIVLSCPTHSPIKIACMSCPDSFSHLQTKGSRNKCHASSNRCLTSSNNVCY